ncbi:MAG: hypothetical protein GY711_19810 [bacterium]|nr:hypothetical protein [bacterium]
MGGPIAGTLRMGRLLGIELRVHVWFLYLYGVLVVGTALFADPRNSLVTRLAVVSSILLLLALLVLLHEYGHSLVARRFGIQVIDITLWPLGGMARMAEIPEDSRTEGLVAAAGPAVNFVLAGLGYVVLKSLTGSFDLTVLSRNPSHSGTPFEPAILLSVFIFINLVMGTFNLIPAFPMDGGRILRAFLGRKGDYLGATERAVAVGRVCAYLMVFGFFLGGGCMLPVIGLYVLYAGSRELWSMRIKHARASGATGAEHPFSDFVRGRGSIFGGPAEQAPHGPSSEDPGATAFPPTGEASDGGFSDEDIERLEKFRGRLRRPDDDA